MRCKGPMEKIIIVFYILLFLIFCARGITKSEASDKVKDEYYNVILSDFENGIPCSHEGDSIGFRKVDKLRASVVQGGANRTAKGAIFKVSPGNKDIFFQGDVRRKYLLTKSEKYIEGGPNALSFWVKLPANSPLIDRVEVIKIGERVVGREKSNKNTLGVWTYHWRYGDMGVGGKSNLSLTTDSMMHAYSDFRFNEKAEGKWVKVVLSPSAFRVSRNYYHFYAARGTTDDLQFFSSLRQLQFHIHADLEKDEDFQIDEIKLVNLQSTATFEKDFYKGKVSKNTGDLSIPVTIKNPTDKDRSYRVFISSFLGVDREILNKIFALTDSLAPMREIQHAVNGDGGIGAVELLSEKGESIISKKQEIFIPAGGIWKGKLMHNIKPEMLGKQVAIKTDGFEFYVRRYSYYVRDCLGPK